MTLFSDTGIKVSPEKIRNTAQRAKKIYERMLVEMEGIEENVMDSQLIWKSDSADRLYRLFRNDKNEYVKLKNGIREKIAKLDEVALLYSNAETEAGGDVSALPKTIIS